MNIKISKIHTFKELGVTVEDKLNFNVQLQTITTDVRKLTGYILNQ